MAQLVKESAHNAGDLGSIPGLGRPAEEGGGHEELDMTEWLSLHYVSENVLCTKSISMTKTETKTQTWRSLS